MTNPALYFEEIAARKRDRHATVLAVVAIVSVIVVFVLLGLAQSTGWIAAFGIGGLIVSTGAAAGGLLGFLFSVPRILSQDTGGSATAAPADAKGGASTSSDAAVEKKRARLLASNTNLERISEWLTTMLVGVGLSQINLIGAKFRAFSDFLSVHARVFVAGGLADAGVLPVVGPFVLLFGLVLGFVFLYLYTRIYLSPLFLHAEIELSLAPNGLGSADVGKEQPQFQRAAEELARNTANPSMKFASVTDTLSIDQSLDVIFNLLYEKGGYDKAITLGLALANTPATRLPRYWFLMCAAHGQKHHVLVKQRASVEELKQVRNAVLDAARQAVRLDPKFKARLRILIDPDSDDNDLRDFEKDPDLLRILT